ncbi:MAG: HAD-IC family P-type ATPase [Alphaproteobacteria bacterium]|nr:HAD-IC family P-type ATPase [Alphaproteobacteria bacterium]
MRGSRPRSKSLLIEGNSGIPINRDDGVTIAKKIEPTRPAERLGTQLPTRAERSPAGLSSQAAAERLRVEGFNELPSRSHRTPLRIVYDVVREPMFGLLMAAGAIYLLLGDLEEALLLVAFATLSVSIAVVQESRTERVLEALRDLTSPRALVVRDGQQQRIAGREVVKGDVLIVGEGDRIAADAVLIAGRDVQTDESLLTGESAPARKTPAAESRDGMERPGGDDLPYLFSGTLVVRGQGTAIVQATGARTEIGRIGSALNTISSEQPRLTLQTRGLIRAFALVSVTLTATAIVLYGLLRGGWLEAVLSGIAVGMSLLPEEFPLVLTAFMAMGAWRMSRIGVLTRHAAAIETLGAATVLCTDKTGTLTQNCMSIAELRTFEEILRVEPELTLSASSRLLVEVGVLASKPAPFDPMEQAIHALSDRIGQPKPTTGGLRLEHEYPLSPELLAVTHVWRAPNDTSFTVAAKGAPEAIARLCRLDPMDQERVGAMTNKMAANGMRVLGVARASFVGLSLPSVAHDFTFEFVGLVGLVDPLRPSVPAAVARCRAAGIRLIMITGDYPATAQAIAREAGIAADRVVTGAELKLMSDDKLALSVRSATIFARVMPEQKLRIVNALKANGEVVAMTGDGVNDAPSLKAAHIGIAMGNRGTDVAREASAIVLLDDDFASIVTTIELGRRIYDNLRKAMGYILAVHVPIAGLAVLPILLGWPLILTPVHIAFLEMVIDPVCSFVFEAERAERNAMSRPPRDPDSPLFSGALVAWSLVQGGLLLLVVVGIEFSALQSEVEEPVVRAVTFSTLVAGNIGLILVNRSFSTSLVSALFRPNRALWLVIGVTTLVLSVALNWAPASQLFRFGPLQAVDVVICIASGAGVLLVLELVKPAWRRSLQT